jgi:phenylpropionate dioxygenase-like ring-hydroxylating dioxygenase large terminal subunit
MMSHEQNDLITRVGPGTKCGALMRHYWHPVALADELPDERPAKAVRVLGQDFVLFRDERGRHGLLDRGCPHRGADLAYGRLENGGLRCLFHGWLFDVDGKCLETPAEPDGSVLCQRVRQKSYPVVVKNGIIFAWLGEGEAPAFPDFDCFLAPGTHAFAFKGMIDCNWLQALEVGIDPAHASYLHRFYEDEDPSGDAYGKQFRANSADSNIPMSRMMRDHARPTIDVEGTDYGLRLFTLRKISEKHTHVRVTNLVFPYAFVIPMSTEMTITQWHVPIDDESCYWYLHQLRKAGRSPADARAKAATVRAAGLQAANRPAEQLRLQRRRAEDPDLHRHGLRHQRARPVGDREPGPYPGPHARAPGLQRQGDHRLSPPAALGDRPGDSRREAADVARPGAGGRDSRAGDRRRHGSDRGVGGLLEGIRRAPAQGIELGGEDALAVGGVAA